MAPQYKWANPQEWLLAQAEHWPAEMLLSVVIDLVSRTDADTIQDLFQPEMDRDGYFRPIPRKGMS